MATEEDAIDEFLIISYITLEDLEVKILFCFYFCFGGSALVFINFIFYLFLLKFFFFLLR